MINEVKLPPIAGYVVRENADGDQYYYKIDSEPNFNDKIIIKKDCTIDLPPSIDNLYRVLLVGGGGSVSKGKNGANSKSLIVPITILEENKNIEIIIGKAGCNGSNGGTTIFGKYAYALGGEAGNDTPICAFNYLGDIYGKGQTPENEATDGICIVEYCR